MTTRNNKTTKTCLQISVNITQHQNKLISLSIIKIKCIPSLKEKKQADSRSLYLKFKCSSSSCSKKTTSKENLPPTFHNILCASFRVLLTTGKLSLIVLFLFFSTNEKHDTKWNWPRASVQIYSH